MTTAQTKFAVQSITFNNSTTPFIEGFKADSFEAANGVIRDGANFITHDGYEKVDITITWTNGFSYALRFDITGEMFYNCDFAKYFKERLLIITGQLKPWHQTEQQYAVYQTMFKAEHVEFAKRILETCEL